MKSYYTIFGLIVLVSLSSQSHAYYSSLTPNQAGFQLSFDSNAGETTYMGMESKASVSKSDFAEVRVKVGKGVSCIRQSAIKPINGFPEFPRYHCDFYFDQSGNFLDTPAPINSERVNFALTSRLELEAPPGLVKGFASRDEVEDDLEIDGKVGRYLYTNLNPGAEPNTDDLGPNELGKISSGIFSCVEKYVKQHILPKRVVVCSISAAVILSRQ